MNQSSQLSLTQVPRRNRSDQFLLFPSSTKHSHLFSKASLQKHSTRLYSYRYDDGFETTTLCNFVAADSRI